MFSNIRCHGYQKGVILNKSKGCYEGFVDLGEHIVACDEDDTVATESLIFMLSYLQFSWKHPIGYVLIDKITVTCDGTSTNFKTVKLLGCKIGGNLNEIDGTFTFPGYGHNIYFTPDACHMLKFARNALSDLKVLGDKNNNLIHWSYIQHLHEEQLEEGLKFGNKLSNVHKMNVCIAAQTLSGSVADAIEFHMLSDHLKFQGAEATIHFIRLIDELFDLLNSRSPHGKD